MMDHDDARFSSFTRDLARRQRRPRSFPPSPTRADALEQLCGGGAVVPPTPEASPSAPATLPQALADQFDIDDHGPS